MRLYIRTVSAIAALALAACRHEAVTSPRVAEASASRVLVATDGTPKLDSMVVLVGRDTLHLPADSLRFRAIKTADIQSVEVLKGRAAVERFGRAAVNGAILITLKEQ